MAVITDEEKAIITDKNNELWDKYLESDRQDINIRNKIVTNNSKLAQSEAHRLHRMTFTYSIYDDLEQQAMISLIWAVEKFQPDKGYQFSTFAVPVIRGRLMNFIRDKSALIKIPRKINEDIGAIKKMEKEGELSQSDKQNYKSLIGDITNCRFYKPIINNSDNYLAPDINNNNFLADTKFLIPSANAQMLTRLMMKRSPTPFDILDFRKLCRKTQIKVEVLVN